MTGTPKSQRRTLLKTAGALTGLGVLGRLTTAQDTTDSGTTTTNGTSNTTSTTNQSDGNGGQESRRTIILGARVGHWLGLAPKVIEGRRNPTLGFIPTERYKVIWINLDGKRHEFQILGQKNGDFGQVIYRTDSSSKRGETRTLTFEPTDRIRRYRCRYHPDSMRGDIDRSGRFGGGGGTFTTGTTGTETTEGTFDTETTGGTFTTETTDGTFTTDGRFTTDTTDGTFTSDTTDGTFTTDTTETTSR
ncbi:blue (type 1) copper domain protein [Haladaptatus paucihalophilus DX253]|uniref:Blue (Type 1) copper domain protein n=1 Tax=Haladaptatus paucihalophilus DX253 TaxID=797209 RepID=E7QMS3_HALPU|nr:MULTISPECIES: hypothetical protein [Haladaptatus]EFW93718.1 blue (type 1) copper domain protein [Haladaptatus paucihalophilus DX253]GKZ15050.1 hypothetical protein HAL_29310 [Haladaptatus sp. T7]SHL48855.1 hypothetical protein SAMN05444342_3941 [Haladaptatus paucihalophilus DX253]